MSISKPFPSHFWGQESRAAFLPETHLPITKLASSEEGDDGSAKVVTQLARGAGQWVGTGVTGGYWAQAMAYSPKHIAQRHPEGRAVFPRSNAKMFIRRGRQER